MPECKSGNVKRLKAHSIEKRSASKILITGAEGYVGSNLKSFLRSAGYDVYGIDLKKVSDEKTFQLDITDLQRVFRVLNSIKPDVAIHTAALSSLNECERNPQLAMKVNVETTKNICDAINKINPASKLVFLSSDYVFDGERGQYCEDDLAEPKTVYGRTKLLAETVVKENMENYIICRTANVYGKGGNFFNFVLHALQDDRSIDVFDDVFYTPTFIDYLLDSLKALLELNFNGVVHIAGREKLSRYTFALKMAETLGKTKELVKPVKAVGQLVAKDSSLNCEYSRKLLSNPWPTAEESLHYCFGNLTPPYFHFVDERGNFVGIFQGQRWEEINYIESITGSVRGKHYHKETREGFFIIDGKIRVYLMDITNNSKRVFIARKSDIVIIEPNILHTFEMLENSRWINVLSKPLKGDVRDIHTKDD
jgi:dTDP-4-dehydrorhamnose reductase